MFYRPSDGELVKLRQVSVAGACTVVLACIFVGPVAVLVAKASLPGVALASLPPVKVATPSIVVAPAPVKATVPAVKVTTPPVTVTVPPVKVAAPPVKVTTPPVKVATPPVKVSTPPVKVSAPPVKVAPPVKAGAPPVKVTVPSVKVTAPSKSAGAPSVSVRTPSVRVSTPPVGASGAPSSRAGGQGASSASGGAGVSHRAGSSGDSSSSSHRVSTGAGSSTALGASVPTSLSGYGPSSSAPASSRPTPAAPGSRSARGVKHGTNSLIAAVRPLEGCLVDLPDQLRLVLELRTGVGSTRILSRGAVATYLHVRVKQVSGLEQRGLGQLRLAARTYGCAEQVSGGQGLFSLASFTATSGGADGDGLGGALGEVKAFRYGASPTWEIPGASGGGGVLGLDPRALVSHGAVFAIVLALMGLLSVAFLFADGLGVGPRHSARWRRWTRQTPWS